MVSSVPFDPYITALGYEPGHLTPYRIPTVSPMDLIERRSTCEGEGHKTDARVRHTHRVCRLKMRKKESFIARFSWNHSASTTFSAASTAVFTAVFTAATTAAATAAATPCYNLLLARPPLLLLRNGDRANHAALRRVNTPRTAAEADRMKTYNTRKEEGRKEGGRRTTDVCISIGPNFHVYMTRTLQHFT